MVQNRINQLQKLVFQPFTAYIFVLVMVVCGPASLYLFRLFDIVNSVNTSKRNPPHLLMLVAISAVNPLALNIFMPSMPGMVRVFNTDYTTVQLTLTLFLASIAVSQLFIGPLSDRFGRRPVVIYGTSIFLLASVVCIYATSIEMLIIGRVFQAFGGCTGMVMGRAIIRDMHGLDKSASMMGYVTMAMVVAPMMAPWFGGQLDILYGWQASFIVVFVYTAVVLAFGYFLIGETHKGPFRAENPLRMLVGYGSLLGNLQFLRPALQISFSTGAFFAFLGGAPYVTMELLGGTPVDYGAYFMVASTCYMIGNFVTGRMSEKWGADRLVAFGLFFAMSGGLWLIANYYFFGLSLLTLFCGMGFIALGNGMSLPSGTAAAISADPSRVGAAAGLSGSMQLTTGAVASYLSGLYLTGSDTALPLVIIMSLCATLAIVAHVGGGVLAARRAPSSK